MQSNQIAASRLTEEDVKAFQQLMLEECGVDLSMAEAWPRATKLVAMFRALIGPIPEDSGLRDTSFPQAAPLA